MGSAEDRFAIIDLAALYMRALDRLDETLLADQFWPDARLEYGIFAGGAADFAACCMAALKDHDANQHMLGQHLIDFTAPGEAFGEVYYQETFSAMCQDYFTVGLVGEIWKKNTDNIPQEKRR